MKRPGEAVSKRVIGCGYEVNNELGAGFFEAVYEQALCLEFGRQGLAYERQKHLVKCRVRLAAPYLIRRELIILLD
ncbi:MAG: GxxExxY protein [Candidatus Thiodiazotropha sp.]